jgi:hypothetical protein
MSEVDRAAAHARLEDYALQLRLYSHLHEQVHDVRPVRCRLVFLNEIQVGNPKAKWRDYAATSLSTEEWAAAEGAMSSEHPGMFFSVPAAEEHVRGAVESFRHTGRRILEARRNDAYPPPAESELPDTQTCDACDLRFSCAPACEVHRYK